MDDSIDLAQPLGQLARALDQLSTHLGQSVTERQWLLIAEQQGLGEEVEVDAFGIAKRLWGQHFPAGRIVPKPFESLSEHELPALTVVSEQPALITGVSETGIWVRVSDQVPALIPFDQCDSGALVMSCGPSKAMEEGFDVQGIFKQACAAHRTLLREALVASILAGLFGVASALYTMQVYDRVVPTGALPTLYVLTAGVLLTLFLEFLAKQIKTSFIDRASDSIDRSLGQLFFERGLDLRLNTRPKTVGTMAAQIKGFDSVRQFMMTSLLFFGADLPFAFLFLSVIWFIGGSVVLVPLIILPIGILFGLSLRRPLETYTKQNMTEANLRNGLLIESLDGIEGVKAAGGNSTFAHRWFGLTEAVSDGELKVKRLSALSSNFSQSLQQLSYVGIVAYGAVLVTQGELTMGALIACSILSGRALGAFSQFPNMLVQAKKSKIALEALTGAMRLSADRDGTHRRAVLDKPVGALASDALQFGYDPSLLTLELPPLEFKPGERVAVLGSVGSGKSTLVRLFAGLYQPSQGSVRYDGYDFNLLNPDFLREQILYLPQEARLFGGTLRENLTLGLPMVAESELAEACAKTGLDQVIAGHPHGLELRISEGGQGLSGGQKQLVAFTRALLAKPRIVLLDEPMASMDRGLEERLMGLLLDGLPKDTTVILVTHKLQHVRRVDRVMILERGKLVIDGPSAEVMAQMQRAAPAEGKS